MTAVAMPAPAGFTPAPQAVTGRAGLALPAPVATILAVLARVTSHAGDPLSVTVTEPVHSITINVADRERYAAWRQMLDAGAGRTGGDDLGTLARSHAEKHGWQMTVQIATPS